MMKVAAWAAARGDWVHVFPEGKIQLNGKLGAFKWGVGKMVSAETHSVRLTYTHTGEPFPRTTVKSPGAFKWRVGKVVGCSRRCPCVGVQLHTHTHTHPFTNSTLFSERFV